MKKIISIPDKTLWNWHVACELEVLESALQKGHVVQACIPHWMDVNVDNRHAKDAPIEVNSLTPNGFWKKKWFESKAKNGYKQLSQKIQVSVMSQQELPEAFLMWTDSVFESCQTLKQVSEQCYQGVHVGASAVSSLVTLHRRSYQECLPLKAELQAYMRCAYAMYLNAVQLIQHESPDAFLIFNGRFASSRGVLDACREHKIECMIHERGNSKNHYEVFYDKLPHDRGGFLERLEKWESSKSRKEIDDLGTLFFEQRRGGVPQGWKSFISQQESGLFPRDWKQDRKNVVIFNSSEDEFFSIGKEWNNPLCKTQVDGVRKILQSVTRHDIAFWVRLHPNLMGVEREEIEGWYELEKEFESLSIIAPDSPISTYSLIDAADKVVTFGSTVGTEATYAQKVSILAGVSFYKGLDACYEPSTLAEAATMVESADLQPKPQKGALLYGAFMRDFGIKAKFLKAIDFNNATFKGIRVKSNPYYSLMAWGPQKSLAHLKVRNKP